MRWLESERAEELTLVFPLLFFCSKCETKCATASFLQVCNVFMSLREHNIPASVSRYRFCHSCFGTFETLMKLLCIIYQLSLCFL